MDKVSSKSKLSDIVSVAQLKKKFKAYLVDKDYADFKSSVFPRKLIYVLISVLEELLSDSLEYIVKNEVNGLYIINVDMINSVLNKSNKYDCLLKFIRKYSSTVKYQDSVFFNIKKVLDNLESKYGSKLSVNPECRNFISYLVLSLQYEFTELAINMVDYANRKTLNLEVLTKVYTFFLDKSISKQIGLKLDSIDEAEAKEEAEAEAEAEEAEEEEEEDD